MSVNGFDLQCTFRTLDHHFFDGISPDGAAPKTGCYATNVDIQSRDQVVTSVNGKDLKSFTGFGYKRLEILRQPVHFIPQGLGEFFPDLEGLKIGNSQTKEVTKNDIAQFPKLKQLHLYSTDIQSLPANLFEENPDLLYIYLGHNKLTHVGKGILSPLKKLHTAYIQGNPCINLYVYSDRSRISTIIVAALESGCRDDTVDAMSKKNDQQKSTSACEPLKSPIFISFN